MATQKLSIRQQTLPDGSPGDVPGYVHIQSVPSNTWTIDHNLGRKPAGIRVEDSVGDIWYPDRIEDPSLNQTILMFGVVTFGGKAFLI